MHVPLLGLSIKYHPVRLHGEYRIHTIRPKHTDKIKLKIKSQPHQVKIVQFNHEAMPKPLVHTTTKYKATNKTEGNRRGQN